jgi:hypothetical protein
MSKNSPFAYFADSVEPPTEPIVLDTGKQLTIGQLSEFLNEQAEKDASIKELPVHHVDSWYLRRTEVVVLDADHNRLVFGDKLSESEFHESEVSPTVGELIEFLDEMLAKYPHIKKLPVYRVEGFALREAFRAIIDMANEKFIIE